MKESHCISCVLDLKSHILTMTTNQFPIHPWLEKILACFVQLSCTAVDNETKPLLSKIH